MSLLAVILTPLSTSSGESLEEHLPRTRLIHEHTELAGLLIWWVIPLAVVAVGLWWLHSRQSTASA